MFRKISYTIAAFAIVTAGCIGFSKLNYWERSVWILKSGSRTESFEGRGNGRGRFENRLPQNRPSREGRVSPGREENFRRKEGISVDGPGSVNRQRPDSIRREFRAGDERFFGEVRGRGMHGFEGERRGGFDGGKKIRLGGVLWFLAVFAGFTVLTLYADKAVSLLKRRR